MHPRSDSLIRTGILLCYCRCNSTDGPTVAILQVDVDGESPAIVNNMEAEVQLLLQTLRESYGPGGRCFTAPTLHKPCKRQTNME